MPKHIITILLIIIFMQFTFAQTKNELWSKVIIAHNLSEKWGISFDYNYRWQTNELNQNLFHNKMLEAYRLEIIYKYNRSFQVSLAPHSLWNSNGLILEESDRVKEPTLEKRWILNFEYNRPLSKSITWFTRLSNEYRMVPKYDIVRLRLRPLLNYISPKNRAVRLSAEILLNAYGQDVRFFDQARGSFDFSQPINDHLKILVGYTNNYRANTHIGHPLNEHIFLVTSILNM